MRWGMFLLMAALATPAAGEGVKTLRIATVAPDGTAWAHEMTAWTREVESATQGALKLKLYFGGIAGGELDVLDRIKRRQLDGAISGGMICSRLGPSLRILRVIGMVKDRQEATWLISRLKPRIDDEFRQRGFVHIGDALVGMDVLFARGPLRTLDDLRKTRFWIWDLDQIVQAQLTRLGIPFRPAPLPEAAELYNKRQVDGFFTVPGAALAFQWSTLAAYVAPLELTALAGCVLFTHEAFDGLPNPAKVAVLAATAKLQARFNDTTAAQDQQLLGRLFEKQGLKPLPVTPALREELSRTALEAVREGGSALLPPGLLEEASQLLTEHRQSRQGQR